jgi:hypothetical protein
MWIIFTLVGEPASPAGVLTVSPIMEVRLKTVKSSGVKVRDPAESSLEHPQKKRGIKN